MVDARQMKQAKMAYARLCEMLEKRGWKYDKNEEEMSITSGAKGEDLPVDILMKVDGERMLVALYSKLPYVVPEDKRVELAIAISVINNALVDGCFDYNPFNGNIVFRLTTSIMESHISKEAFEYMLLVSCQTVDIYNDKLLMVIKGVMSLEDLMKFIMEK